MTTFNEAGLVCTRPFTWCEIHSDGSVYACCPSWQKVPLGNLLQQPFQEIWNGTAATGLRRSILDGSFGLCEKQRCPFLIGRRDPVMPLHAVRPEPLRDMLRRGSLKLPCGPSRVNLCYDIRCNLSCPGCRRGALHVGKRTLGRIRQIESHLRRAIGPGVGEMTIGGYGDPFGSPSYLSLLQDLSRREFPRLHTLRLHTNAQLWDAAMWDSMPFARTLVKSAEISIDAATPATYTLNRRGGDFNRLFRNMLFIQGLGLRVTLSFVVQQNNYREMPGFVALGQRFGFDVYFSRLVNWGTFTAKEYAGRAVHLPHHPEHDAFVATLGPLAGIPGVDIGNLRPLAGSPSTVSENPG